MTVDSRSLLDVRFLAPILLVPRVSILQASLPPTSLSANEAVAGRRAGVAHLAGNNCIYADVAHAEAYVTILAC